jgi:predicted nucleic acid-binding protein
MHKGLNMKVVSNSSPLISLSLIKQFGLLKSLYGKLYIPKAVYEEVAILGKGEPGSAETKEAMENGWIKIKQVQDSLAVQVLTKSVDVGEAEAIILAKEMQADIVLLDDPQARSVAEFMGLNIIGVVGMLMLAVAKGLPVVLKESIDQLIKEGFRISPKLYKQILEDFKE